MKRGREIHPMPPEDSEFLGQIYYNHRELMVIAARVYTSGDKVKAEDIVHDAVIRLIRHVQTLKTLSEPALCSYLRATIKTTFADAYKREKRCISLNDAFFQNVADREQELEPDLFLDWKLQRLKEELSPREWMVLEQKFILGYSNEEIAEVLGISPDSVRMTLSRIYKKSRKILLVGVR